MLRAPHIRTARQREPQKLILAYQSFAATSRQDFSRFSLPNPPRSRPLLGMPELPHGWRVRNSNGEVKGPPPESDHSDSEGGSEFSDNAEPLDIRPDSPGWEDVEDDTEMLNIQCLFCATTFPNANAMLDHCTESHDFDFLDVQRQHSMLTLSQIVALFARRAFPSRKVLT